MATRRLIFGGLVGGIAGAKYLDNRIDDLAHPNRGKALDLDHTGYKWDGTLNIPAYSSIIHRNVAASLVPEGELFYDHYSPWAGNIPPSPLNDGISMFTRQPPLAFVVMRKSSFGVLGDGTLVESGDVFKLGGAGTSRVFPDYERVMPIETPWGISGDLRDVVNGSPWDPDVAAVAIRSRRNGVKRQIGLSDSTSSRPPIDTQLDSNNRVIPSPFNGRVISDGQPFTVVATGRTIIGLRNGSLIESPDCGQIQIFNPIRNRVWEPAEMVALCPSMNARSWSEGGSYEAHTNFEGFVTLPLFDAFDDRLRSYFNVDRGSPSYSLDSFVRYWASTIDMLHPRPESLAPWDYSLDFPPADDWATDLNFLAKAVPRLPGVAAPEPHVADAQGSLPYPEGHTPPPSEDAGVRLWNIQKGVYANPDTSAIDQLVPKVAGIEL